MKIAAKYEWLARIPGAPKMVQEAVKLGRLNTTEIPGAKSNQEIMALAKEAGLEKIYTSDETAWCGLAMTVLALRAGKVVPFQNYFRLRAASFLKFGTSAKVPMLGDVLVFERPGGYHVGLYVAEDDDCYHVAGGNQSNQFSVTRILKSRLKGVRRPAYSIGQPESVKQYFIDPAGQVSTNEA